MQRVNELYGQLENCKDDDKKLLLLFDLSTSLLNFDERKNQEVTEELGVLAERLDSNIGRSYYHSSRARLLFRKSLFKEAAVEFELACEKAMLTDDMVIRASCLDSLGIANRLQGKFKESEETHSRALGLFKTVPNTDNYQSVCYNNLGTLYKDLKDFDKAQQMFELGIAFGKQGDDFRMVCNLRNNLAAICIMTGKFEAGAVHATMALTGFRELKHKHGEVHALVFLGHCICGLGSYAEALQHYLNCIKLLKNVDHKLVEVQAYKGIGNVYANMDACEEALKNYNKAFELCMSVSVYEEACEIQLAIANMYSLAQKTALAKQHADIALALATEHQLSHILEKIANTQTKMGEAAAAD